MLLSTFASTWGLFFSCCFNFKEVNKEHDFLISSLQIIVSLGIVIVLYVYDSVEEREGKKERNEGTGVLETKRK